MATSSQLENFENLFEFRPLTKDNLSIVRALHDDLLPIKYSDNFYKALLNGLYKSLLLYQREQDVLIGVSSWKIEKRKSSDDNNSDDPSHYIQIGYLATFGIKNTFRRRGLGKYLLLSTFSTMQHQKCQLCELHVLSTNIAARNLYVNKCGFKVKLKLPNHYHFNDKHHDAFLLIKSLKSSKTNDEIEISDDEDDKEESKSIADRGDRERSPPIYTQTIDEEDDEYRDNTNKMSMRSLEKQTLIDIDEDAADIPISNWIGNHVDSLWIKCVIL